MIWQTTLARATRLSGVGVHNGLPVTATFLPAPAGSGIAFRRVDLPGKPTIAARHDRVSATALCTVIGDPAGAHVSTVEHLMAALHALEIDNALIEIDGPEAPIVDGSAAPFVEVLDTAGVVTLDAPRRFIKVLKTVVVGDETAGAKLSPATSGFGIDVEIDFDTPLIGRQRIVLDVTPAAFRSELSRARTFGFMKDVERLVPAGFARGSSLENTVVLDETRILNPEGLRMTDEFVRHKALDAIGDLSLSGLPLIGRFRSWRGGHRINADVLAALFADRSAWTVVEAGVPALQPQLPAVAARPIAACAAPSR